MLTLPVEAFVPQRHLSAQERQAFIAKRDRLFASCTPAEQYCLVSLGQWWCGRRQRLLATPNIFSESYLTEFKRRHFPWSGIKPRIGVRVLAATSVKIAAMEKWHGQRLQAAFVAQLEAMRRRGEHEVVMGVANYLRSLPVEFNTNGSPSLARQLEEMVNSCAQDATVDPKKRIASLIRTLQARSIGFDGELRAHVWKILLEVAEQDLAAAARLVDTHWQSKDSLPVLMTLHLHGNPGLALCLALAFQAHRPEFAADMMETSIQESVFMLAKCTAAERDPLAQSIDASCRTLASWTDMLRSGSAAAALQAIRCLLRHGNPEDDYWPQLGRFALDILQGLAPDGRRTHVNIGVMAQVAAYSPSGSPQEAEALALFEACATEALAVSEEWSFALQEMCSALAYASTVLEDKAISLRNVRMTVNPSHPLQQILERCVQAALDRAMARTSHDALGFLVSFTAMHWNEALTRKLHGILRDRFAYHMPASLAAAGKALKAAAMYQSSRQVADETYRTALWQETFDLLIPVLARVSPGDAAIARAAIGYNPRSDYI
ncbi:hypothetical protein G4G28_11075 [Massilia sp. Dwa41.01b]|uniref:hypothetical protein n=1 Tax=unclassified Massilia TaxID=2609279 RepID=UPI001601EC4C|nr:MULTISPECIES: hypothetical protein [unclassified Massilia]QNA88894.1 hypothetical protein G4G28_11075 [Massilia sp. Dwa41.01b]QNA99784.1 hypothetical protein G4G31_14705 [Massilia sp. Se16.2.3]